MRRRGIHALVSVSIMSGFAILMAGAVFYVVSEQADVGLEQAACTLDYDLHDTGPGRAYLSVSVRNTGTIDIHAIRTMFEDDSGVEHGFRESGIELEPGQVWFKKGSLAAYIDGSGYLVQAVVEAGRSQAGCI